MAMLNNQMVLLINGWDMLIWKDWFMIEHGWFLLVVNLTNHFANFWTNPTYHEIRYWPNSRGVGTGTLINSINMTVIYKYITYKTRGSKQRIYAFSSVTLKTLINSHELCTSSMGWKHPSLVTFGPPGWYPPHLLSLFTDITDVFLCHIHNILIYLNK